MKYFIVEITYSVPIDKIAAITPLHRGFLKQWYEKGWFLMSGPQNPRVGGMVVARAPSLEEIQAVFQNDPYFLNDAATYNFTEFEPVMHAPVIDSWFE